MIDYGRRFVSIVSASIHFQLPQFNLFSSTVIYCIIIIAQYLNNDNELSIFNANI